MNMLFRVVTFSSIDEIMLKRAYIPCGSLDYNNKPLYPQKYMLKWGNKRYSNAVPRQNGAARDPRVILPLPQIEI